jgi:DNA-binding IclR family transcriptional regulator
MTVSRAVSKRLSPSNRSVERGLEILKAFRPGSTVLENSEIADRTGLPRSTVSRLTTTLVRAGFLDWDGSAEAYRLGAPVLALAQSFRLGSPILEIALPKMRELADAERVNVGLAVSDGDEMIYLDSVRRSRSELFRHLAAGTRIPMELTSLGRAFLGTVAQRDLRRLLARFRTRHPSNWPVTRRAILQSIADVRTNGYCVANWQPGIFAIGAPLVIPHFPVHVFNISAASQSLSPGRSQEVLAGKLLLLVRDVRDAFNARDNE